MRAIKIDSYYLASTFCAAQRPQLLQLTKMILSKGLIHNLDIVITYEKML